MNQYVPVCWAPESLLRRACARLEAAHLNRRPGRMPGRHSFVRRDPIDLERTADDSSSTQTSQALIPRARSVISRSSPPRWTSPGPPGWLEIPRGECTDLRQISHRTSPPPRRVTRAPLGLLFEAPGSIENARPITILGRERRNIAIALRFIEYGQEGPCPVARAAGFVLS